MLFSLSITALDIENSLAILQHGEAGLLIDYCLCLSHEAIDDRSSGSSRRGAEYSKQYRTALPELKSKMMVMGELVHAGENTKSELSGGRDGIVPGILLQATLLKECIDLDLALWERAARVESQARWSEVEQRQRR